MIGEGSIGVEATSLFTAFISNKLDKIISPTEIFNIADFQKVKTSILDVTGERNKENHRQDIASAIVVRMSNYLINLAEKSTVTKDILNRMEQLVTSELFSQDLCYRFVRQVYNSDRQKFAAVLANKELVKWIMD